VLARIGHATRGNGNSAKGSQMITRAVLLSAWILFAPWLPAQTEATGSLTGKLTETSGAPIANATVTATNPDTGQSRVATTGAHGSY